MSDPKWRKSSYSADVHQNCVELAAAPDDIHIRESDEPNAVIHTSPAALRSFIRAAKATHLDHLR
ncbi:DUF397 domain-containing protein [Streptomyces sp. SID8361]|uniref:DUF397 domain-containing protein n=1 Tax=Streptomyces TaxID=1883 RepID=UPI00081E2CAA|nr:MULTISPECIES: DUF397 domain-containing protein [unclassified Streptomyces]AUA12223.1 hypothetical protein CFP59_04352 [Streptomyces sp. M56]MYU12705.1 DUF397 domain-containing protein [Streptomyces sp. SID8361]MYX63224.1 DUF397 domain-containing protein [Streptomyces sp. SID8382]SCF94325.1 protein of unknown function [Streptomyces sp. MnatMP-M27]